MSVKNTASIVGVADIDLVDGKVIGDKSVLQIQAEVVKEALKDAGIEKSEVDGMFTTGTWGIPGVGQAPSATLAAYMGIEPSYTDTTQIGGSAFEAHVGHAAAAISAGLCEVAVIVYGSRQKSDKQRNLNPRPAELVQQWDSIWGLPAPAGAYAMAANRHMYQYGTTSEQLAEIAVATRKWATLNEKATKRDPISVDDVLNSPMICDPLHLLDCCLVTDGAGAVIITSKERARDCRKKPINILGHGEAHTHWIINDMPDLTVTPAYHSGNRAFEMAGVTHSDIDVVEIYDSFTTTVLLTLESLGFCKPGEGGDFVSNQRTAPDGDFPMNTNGGGLSYAHPGMYGIFLIIEAVRQLRGECGSRQVSNAELALVNGTGGTLSSAATCILGE